MYVPIHTGSIRNNASHDLTLIKLTVIRCVNIGKGKCNVHPRTVHEGPEGK